MVLFLLEMSGAQGHARRGNSHRMDIHRRRRHVTSLSADPVARVCADIPQSCTPRGSAVLSLSQCRDGVEICRFAQRMRRTKPRNVETRKRRETCERLE
ncbi:hypothetical protein AMELA_G00183160 [Ameiurus melas]|uniref:Uncharacterized protein n=1 Tax=Ameiurus melas TaxID=219545 RepID=A0A7J6AB44_AMEME|nr:hypothetical protein AMELA_G00183160 [Ameiurus melas]